MFRGVALADLSDQRATEADKIADDRVNEMLQGLRDGKFDVAENHFDSKMKSLFGPSALEQAWKQRRFAWSTHRLADRRAGKHGRNSGSDCEH
jgi:hypothetical protein